MFPFDDVIMNLQTTHFSSQKPSGWQPEHIGWSHILVGLASHNLQTFLLQKISVSFSPLTQLTKADVNNVRRRTWKHYSDVTMRVIASHITDISTVCSSVCSGAHQRKHQMSASLAFVRGIHRRSVDSPHKGPVTRKMFPFDDVIMTWCEGHGITGCHQMMLVDWLTSSAGHSK